MDISKAKKFVELNKGDRKILVTIYEGGQVSSCIEDEAKKSYCETCQEWIEHLKSQGYQATEIELGELEIEESLPKFLEQRVAAVKPKVAIAVQPGTVVVEDSLVEPEGNEHAISGALEDLPGGGETPPEGE